MINLNFVQEQHLENYCYRYDYAIDADYFVKISDYFDHTLIAGFKIYPSVYLPFYIYNYKKFKIDVV